MADTFPLPFDAYPPASPDGLLATLAARVDADPFNAVATVIFLLAVIHTFVAVRFAHLAHEVQHRHDQAAVRAGRPSLPHPVAEVLHLFG